MPKGYSLHVGVNKVDLNHYIQLQELRAAVNDANFMADVAKNRFGYARTELFTNETATSTNILRTLDEYASALEAGDILMLSYSGHGGQVEDPHWKSKGEDEPIDSTWCLYDRQLIDDELFQAFQQFKAGVRILVISDSCHSGTVTRVYDDNAAQETAFENALKELMAGHDIRPKEMTPAQSNNVYAKNFNLYKLIQDGVKKIFRTKTDEIGASVMLFSACQDNQVAFDGPQHGRFTAALKQAIENGYQGARTSAELYQILKNSFSYPTPNLFQYGAHIPGFENNIPFFIEIPDSTVSGRVADAPPSVPQAASAVVASSAASLASMRIRVMVESPILTNEIVMGLLPSGVVRMNQNGQDLTLEFERNRFGNVWDAVYAVTDLVDNQGVTAVVEPIETATGPVMDQDELSKAASESFDYMPQWPPVSLGQSASPDWYFDQDHSQLAAARDFVMAEIAAGRLNGKVRIGHLDTGFWPAHAAVRNNPNIRKDLAKSFVPTEVNNPGLDIYYGKGEQQDHGLGTLCILAGWKVKKENTYDVEMPYVGAAPFAEVIPIRIADKVVILDSNSFCDGVEYAIAQGCDVISMSMGGKPSAKMAKAINKAYEAGVVVVTAAGNSFTKGAASVGPRTVVWPARFARVIAACGVCQNQVPYDFAAQERFAQSQLKSADLDFMQGNWGPASAMRYALAAYTPNVLWASRSGDRLFKKSGGGTSSATPQVAAAAALYIARHRDELEAKGYYQAGHQWKKVEAVRRALFASADKTIFPESDKYFGNGILRARKALEIPVADISDDMKAPKAESSWWGLSEAVGIFINRRRANIAAIGAARQQALAFELHHVLMSDPALSDLYNELATEDHWDEATLERVAGAVRGSAYCSGALLEVL